MCRLEHKIAYYAIKLTPFEFFQLVGHDNKYFYKLFQSASTASLVLKIKVTVKPYIK